MVQEKQLDRNKEIVSSSVHKLYLEKKVSPELNHPEMTPCGWQNIKTQLLTRINASADEQQQADHASR